MPFYSESKIFFLNFFSFFIKSYNKIKIIRFFNLFLFSFFFITIFACTIFDSLDQENKKSNQLAINTANELQKIFRDNEALLIFIGESLRKYYSHENFLESAEDLLKLTPELSLSSLMTSYINLANSDGYIIVSGKSGITMKEKKSIRSRRYFEESLNQPWKLKFSNPERSLCSDVYILPTVMGITSETKKPIGFLVLGLKINQIYSKLEKFNFNKNYKILIYDLGNKKYVPIENPEDTLLPEKLNDDLIKISLKNYPYEIHIQKISLMIPLEKFQRNLIYVLYFLLLTLIIIFQGEFFINKILKKIYLLVKLTKNPPSEKSVTLHLGQEKYLLSEFLDLKKNLEAILSKDKNSHDQFKLLYKSKQLIEAALKKRESYFNASFNRIEKNVDELDVCFELIKNCDYGDKRKDLIQRGQTILSNLKDFSYSKNKITSFSFNSLIEDCLNHYSHEFFEKEVKIVKNLSKKLPVIFGDEFFIKYIFICIFEKIVKDSYGLRKLFIKTTLLCSSNNIIIMIEEALSEGCQFIPIDEAEFVSKLQGSGIGFSLEKSDKKRVWLIEHPAYSSENLNTPGNIKKFDSLKEKQKPKQGLKIIPRSLDTP